MNDKTYPFIMNQTHYRIPQKVSAKRRAGGVRAMGMKRKLTRNVRFLPARDGKERADAWVPPERAIRHEGREMEIARGHREDEQRVDERCHARLPINCRVIVVSAHSRTPPSACTQKRTTQLKEITSLTTTMMARKRTTRRDRAILMHPNPSSRGGSARIQARRGGVWLRIRLWR